MKKPIKAIPVTGCGQILVLFLGVAGLMVIFIPGTFSLLSSGDEAEYELRVQELEAEGLTRSEAQGVVDAAAVMEAPNLYELTRQTAKNTRHIFWVLVVGFVCLFGFYMPMLIRRNKAT